MAEAGAAAAAKKRSTRPKAAPEPEPAQRPGQPHACTVGFCPICLAISALQPLKPDVVEHLLNAGREFFMAVKAVVEARAEDLAGDGEDPRRLERIDIA